MSDIIENETCGAVTCATAGLGGVAGLSSLIYYSATVIQPKLEKTKEINKVESDVIAAAVCLSGVALIVVIGIMAGACIGGSPNYFYEAAKKTRDSCHAFFSTKKKEEKISQEPSVRAKWFDALECI